MRRTAFLLIAALVLALSAAPAALAQADKDCADFSSQAEAQAYFEANGGSPTNNVENLDADHDGQACEAFNYGGDGGGGTGGDGGAGTGGGGTGGDDGDLPFTGPNNTLLPAGTGLLLAGLALVGVTRYRARHTRRQLRTSGRPSRQRGPPAGVIGRRRRPSVPARRAISSRPR